MKKRTFVYSISLILLAGFFGSCSSDPTSLTFLTKVRFSHMSPNGPTVQAYVRGLPEGTLTYGQFSPYRQYDAGNIPIAVSATANLSDTLIRAIPNFIFGFNYTVYAIDSAQRIRAAVVFDNLNLPNRNIVDSTFMYRFFHFAAGAPNVTVRVIRNAGTSTADTVTTIANRAFNATVPDAQQVYTTVPFSRFGGFTGNVTVQIVQTNNSAVLREFTQALEAGKAYTFIARWQGTNLVQDVQVYNYKTD